jgi:formate hydrogenlyase subunit 3/multisubunit Na+/H+ antiporter MnhD subunit
LAALVAFFLAWLVVRLPLGVVLTLLGRTIELDQLSQVTLSLLFATAAALFFTLTVFSLGRQGARRDALYSKSLGPEVRIFYPAVLVILALFVAANLFRHLGITAIFIELAAILTVFVIQTERLESTRAALRFLILISLATPLFLLAAWQVDVNRLGDSLTLARNVEQIVLFIGVGFALWLAVVPFHGWLTGTATESSPPMAAFVLITFPVVAFSTLIHLLVDLPWLVDSLYLVNAMLLAGVVTAFIGGAMASVQRGFSELLGYAALYDLGCILIVVALGGEAAISTILMSLTVRALALILIAASTSTLHLQVADDGFTQVRGIARQMPVATAGVILGGLTLAGAPLTVGFVPYWQLLNSMAGVDSRWSAILVLAGLGVTIGYLRGLRAALSAEQTSQAAGPNLPLKFQEPLPLLIIISLLGASCILLGLFPSLLIEPLQTVTTGIILPIE